MEAKDEKYPFLHSANSQSFTEPQPLIYQHLKQICTCISILLTYSTSTICKLYSYTQPSPLSLNTNTQTEVRQKYIQQFVIVCPPIFNKDKNHTKISLLIVPTEHHHYPSVNVSLGDSELPHCTAALSGFVWKKIT